MTTEIEQKFFDTFGIGKLSSCQWINSTCYEGSIKGCNDCRCGKYPKITAEKLLELICAVNKFGEEAPFPAYSPIFWSKTREGLQTEILTKATIVSRIHKDFKQAVRKLFEEER